MPSTRLIAVAGRGQGLRMVDPTVPAHSAFVRAVLVHDLGSARGTAQVVDLTYGRCDLSTYSAVMDWLGSEWRVGINDYRERRSYVESQLSKYIRPLSVQVVISASEWVRFVAMVRKHGSRDLVNGVLCAYGLPSKSTRSSIRSLIRTCRQVHRSLLEADCAAVAVVDVSS